MTSLMLDVSNNNSGADIATALQFNDAISNKATEGTGFQDRFFGPWAAIASRVGKPTAPYHFARPGNAPGAVEASFFADYVEQQSGVPRRWVLDLEVTSTSPAGTTSYALEFGHYLALRWPGSARTLYTYPFFAPSFTADPALAQLFDLWIAAYPGGYSYVPDPNTVRRQAPIAPWSSWVAWQYSSIAPVPGIGPCDRSIITPAWYAGGVTPDQGDGFMAVTDAEALYMTAGAIASPELAAPEFVEKLYVNILGRQPDPQGYSLWVWALLNGKINRVQTVQAFVNARHTEHPSEAPIVLPA